MNLDAYSHKEHIMGHVFKTTLLILFSSTFAFSTASGPDHFNVRGVASDDVLWMHPTANYKSKKIGKIPYNARCVKNLGCKERWCEVNYKGTVGWVNGKYLEESGNCLDQKSIHPTLSNTKFDQLMMQIYGRMDTRIASRRDHIQKINDFLHTASLLLIKKHKLEIQMQEFRRHQMAAVGTPPKVTTVMRALDSIEKLNGTSIIDHNGNTLTTMTQLKDAYSKAAKESMQMQRDNYTSENTRESDFSKLEEIIIKSGSSEQKSEIKKSETMRLKGEYRYYKKILDNASIWSLSDRDVAQQKPLFYPKTFIIELLYDKYKLELIRSGKTYDAGELIKRTQNIEEKSIARKHQFNEDYLYELRTRPDRLKKKF